MAGTKDEFLKAMDNISRAALEAQRLVPPEFNPRSREGRVLASLLTRLPEQIEDLKKLLIEGYQPAGSGIIIPGEVIE